MNTTDFLASLGEKKCPTCGGNGEVSYDETDRDGNVERGAGRTPCPDCYPKDEGEYSPEENY